jgi:hypothetical protein
VRYVEATGFQHIRPIRKGNAKETTSENSQLGRMHTQPVQGLDDEKKDEVRRTLRIVICAPYKQGFAPEVLGNGKITAMTRFASSGGDRLAKHRNPTNRQEAVDIGGGNNSAETLRWNP